MIVGFLSYIRLYLVRYKLTDLSSKKIVLSAALQLLTLAGASEARTQLYSIILGDVFYLLSVNVNFRLVQKTKVLSNSYIPLKKIQKLQ